MSDPVHKALAEDIVREIGDKLQQLGTTIGHKNAFDVIVSIAVDTYDTALTMALEKVQEQGARISELEHRLLGCNEGADQLRKEAEVLRHGLAVLAVAPCKHCNRCQNCGGYNVPRGQQKLCTCRP